MRSDMHKVVVERPRWNPGPGKNVRRASLPDELLPKFEGIKRPHTRRKSFTDLLGPLERWLRSQVGRPWNDVYSEACAVIKPDSVIRAHIKTHLLEFVERNTFMKESRVWCYHHVWWSGANEIPMDELSGRRQQFYVHPETGLLCVVPQRKRQRSAYDLNRLRLQMVRRWTSETQLLIQWHGCWFLCEMKPFREIQIIPPFDFLWRMPLCLSHAREAYGRETICVGKRQLSSKDLKRYGLKNSEDKKASLDVFLGTDFLGRIEGAHGNPIRRCIRITFRWFDFNVERTQSQNRNSDQEDVWQTNIITKTDRFFEITSKRRKGFPSETQVKKGFRVVHGNKELREKLGRNDPCPCGSGRRFQKLLPAFGSLRRRAEKILFPRMTN
jgi:hypothetical protein